MKKMYVKPEILVEEMLLETMISTSEGNVGGPDVEGNPNETNEHRGGWGNLWD